MLTLITPTGDRPEAFALCQRWMQAQTYTGPLEWFIVNDGNTPLVRTIHRPWGVHFLQEFPRWEPGRNTQASNIRAALEHIAADARVLVIEDDDHYHPNYLAHMNAMFEHADLIGERFARYYNVREKWGKQHTNGQHSSLAATGMQRNALAYFRTLLTSNHLKFLDMALWKLACKRMLTDNHLVTGIKGMPGRAGIGSGHGSIEKTGHADPHGVLLRSWIGAEDAKAYLP
jgi:hypothetical protein